MTRPRRWRRHRERLSIAPPGFVPRWGYHVYNGRQVSRFHYFITPTDKLCRYIIHGHPWLLELRMQPYAGDGCYYCRTILANRQKLQQHRAARATNQLAFEWSSTTALP